MDNKAPSHPKIYHILHMDRLKSVLADGCLWSDAKMEERPNIGTSIGMNKLKSRRLRELELSCHPGLYIGQCVPFYFSPRSVMLYIMHKGNHHEMAYTGGQEPIVHLEAGLNEAVKWAEKNDKRWAFTLSNAASYMSEHRMNLNHLNEINWNAVQTTDWQDVRDNKQAEFLLEEMFPAQLIEQIGVYSPQIAAQVNRTLENTKYKIQVNVNKNWYY